MCPGGTRGPIASFCIEAHRTGSRALPPVDCLLGGVGGGWRGSVECGWASPSCAANGVLFSIIIFFNFFLRYLLLLPLPPHQGLSLAEMSNIWVRTDRGGPFPRITKRLLPGGGVEGRGARHEERGRHTHTHRRKGHTDRTGTHQMAHHAADTWEEDSSWRTRARPFEERARRVGCEVRAASRFGSRWSVHGDRFPIVQSRCYLLLRALHPIAAGRAAG